MRRVLTLLSDFGWSSPYPATMKAVAASIAPPEVRFVDITHGIRPQDVREGAFVLWSVAPYFPEGTVHCAVVDPGVGTERRGLILVCEGQTFVGPDNGLLVPAAEALGVQSAYEIALSTPYVRREISSTFHGRDVFTPVAAYLTCDVPLEEIGPPVSQWVSLGIDFQGGEFLEAKREFRGEVVYIDHFGNAITNISTETFTSRCAFDEAVALCVGSQEERVMVRRSFSRAEVGELCLVLGSHDLLEIAVREGSARRRLDLKAGQPVTLAP